MGDDIQPGVTWVDGQTVTAASLNSFLADSSLKATSISAKTLISTLGLSDEFLLVQSSTLKKATAQKIHDLIVPEGSFIQRVSTRSSTTDSTTAQIPLDNTKPQNTEGKEYSALTTLITPQYSTSLIRLRLHVNVGVNSGTDSFVQCALFRDSIADSIAVGLTTVAADTALDQFDIEFDDAPATTAQVSYKVRFGPAGAITAYINRRNTEAAVFNGTLFSSLEAIEIKQ